MSMTITEAQRLRDLEATVESQAKIIKSLVGTIEGLCEDLKLVELHREAQKPKRKKAKTHQDIRDNRAAVLKAIDTGIRL